MGEKVADLDNEKTINDIEQPGKEILLKRFVKDQVYFLRGGFLKVRKVTPKDVLLRPLTKVEAEKLKEQILSQSEKENKDEKMPEQAQE